MRSTLVKIFIALILVNLVLVGYYFSITNPRILNKLTDPPDTVPLSIQERFSIVSKLPDIQTNIINTNFITQKLKESGIYTKAAALPALPLNTTFQLLQINIINETPVKTVMELTGLDGEGKSYTYFRLGYNYDRATRTYNIDLSFVPAYVASKSKSQMATSISWHTLMGIYYLSHMTDKDLNSPGTKTFEKMQIYSRSIDNLNNRTFIDIK